MGDELLIVQILAVLALVAIAAVLRFDRPGHARSFTTPLRYRSASISYALAHVSALIVLLLVARQVLLASGWKADAYGRFPHGLPLWTALSLAMIVLFSPIERPLRQALQRLAGIPKGAQHLAARLVRAPYAPPPTIIDEAREMLRMRGIEVDSDWLSAASPAQEKLLRATTLYIELRNLQRQPGYRRFADQAALELDQLRQRFDRLSISASRSLDCVVEVGELRLALDEDPNRAGEVGEPVDQRCRQIVSEMLLDIGSDAAHYHDDACALLARAAMSSFWLPSRRDEALRRMGFAVEPTRRLGGYRMLTLTLVLLYCGISLFFAAFGHRNTELPAVGLTFVIVLSQGGALAIGAIPKRHWGFANSGLAWKTPRPFVIVAGIVALLWATLVNVAVGALMLGGWDGVQTRLADGAHYLPSSAITAVATAWLVQDFRWGPATPERSRRLRDALTMGGVWLFESLLSGLLKPTPVLDLFASAGAIRNLIISFALGALIGALVPASFRTTLPVSRRRQAGKVEPGLAGVTIAAAAPGPAALAEAVSRQPTEASSTR